MKIAFISDTHGQHEDVEIPSCDTLVFCGDWSKGRGSKEEDKEFAEWLKGLDVENIVVIMGNHEMYTEANYPESRKPFDEIDNVHLLMDAEVVLDGIKFYGSAYTPEFFNWAYNGARSVVEAAHTGLPFLGDIWAKIPDDTNVLVTHGPPAGILDRVLDRRTGRVSNEGCRELSKRIDKLSNLKVSAFGHLHLNNGSVEKNGNVTYINAAVLNDAYQRVSGPILINVDK